MPLLTVRGLKVIYVTQTGSKEALRDVSFQLEEGEFLGIMGESGAGKSTVGMALMRLIPPPNVVRGQILYRNEDVLGMDERELRAYRWRQVAMIFQASMNSLDPTSSIGKSFQQLLLDKGVAQNKREARELARKLLEEVRLPEGVLDMYPHQLSGGMRQRVGIAMAISANPSLLIADEPTTALDTVTQFSILNLIIDLKREGRIRSVIFISHDLPVHAYVAERLMVMLKGYVVEEGPKREVFTRPLHPYTQFLVESSKLEGKGLRLKRREGGGCPFSDLCPQAKEVCFRKAPSLVEVSAHHRVACFIYGE